MRKIRKKIWHEENETENLEKMKMRKNYSKIMRKIWKKKKMKKRNQDR